MTNLSRNAPCPCGSGKKYKKCCLAKDEAKARSKNPPAAKPWMERPSPQLPPVPRYPAPPPDPHMKRRLEVAQRFEAADYEERFALFTAAMNEPDLMDGEMAFNMLNELVVEARKRGESARFDAAMVTLRSTLPEVYQEESGYFSFWLLLDAFARRDQAALVTVAAEISALAPHNSQGLERALKPLAFHGYARLIGAMFSTALRGGAASKLREYHIRTGLCYAALDALERGVPTSAMLDPTLKDAELSVFPRKQLEALLPWLERVASQPSPPIQLEELGGRHAEEALELLGAEFIGYLRRVEQVPYALGKLGTDMILDHVAERLRGEPDESSTPKRRGHAPAPRTPLLMLWPTPETFDEFIGGFFSFVDWSPYAGVATLEVLPAWVRFLDARGFVPEGREARVLDDFGELLDSVRKAVARPGEDPALMAALIDWPRPAPAGVRLPASGDSRIAWDLALGEQRKSAPGAD